MIEPTVGRVVWYRHPAENSPIPQLGDPPHAAIVAFVHSERLVNLTVLAHNGRPYPMADVLLLQDSDVPPVAAPYAEWMPYQKGQAAKTEALQAQAAAQASKPAEPAPAPAQPTAAPQAAPPQQPAPPEQEPVQAAPAAPPSSPPPADPAPQNAAQPAPAPTSPVATEAAPQPAATPAS